MNLHEPILLATSNPHKLREIEQVFATRGFHLMSLDQLGDAPPAPPEDQPTFEGNALLKARYYAKRTGRITLADDSGLEVDRLDGAPGVYSARFAGIEGPREVVDPANNEKLIQLVSAIPLEDRTARFVCAMALCSPTEVLGQVRGTIEGLIITEARGSNGFGYDPLFLVPELGRTTAELPPEHKNAISHRGRATQLMLSLISDLKSD